MLQAARRRCALKSGILASRWTHARQFAKQSHAIWKEVPASKVGVLPFAILSEAKSRVLHLQVLVRDNNVDQALKALKKKMQREGIFREMKLRNYYEKPSVRKAREKAEAVRRARKLARKKLQREGLLPSKPVVAKTPGGGGRGGFGGGGSGGGFGGGGGGFGGGGSR